MTQRIHFNTFFLFQTLLVLEKLSQALSITYSIFDQVHQINYTFSSEHCLALPKWKSTLEMLEHRSATHRMSTVKQPTDQMRFSLLACFKILNNAVDQYGQ